MQDLAARMEKRIGDLREIVGGANVLLPVFGGTDGLLAAAVALRAWSPEKVYIVLIDHGFLRKGESDLFYRCLKKSGAAYLKRVHIENEVLSGTVIAEGEQIVGPLARVCDPGGKRKIIAAALKKVVKRAAADWKLADGALYVADAFEGGAQTLFAALGKSLSVFDGIEREELPAVAAWLGLEKLRIDGLPFPLTGLGCRILCNDSALAITTEQRDALDALIAEVNQTERIRQVKDLHPDEAGYQYVARIAPIRAKIRQGDAEFNKCFVVLYGNVQAGFGEAIRIARNIPQRLRFVGRVAFRIDTAKSFSLLHVHTLHLTRDVAECLRVADAIVAETLGESGLSQCFALLLPITSVPGKNGSIAVRALVPDADGVRVAVPGEDFPIGALSALVEKLLTALGDKIDMVLYDLTDQPIEWE